MPFLSQFFARAALIAILFAPNAHAENSDTAAVGALLQASGARARHERMLESIIDEMNTDFFNNLGASLERQHFTAEKKIAAQRLMTKHFNSFTAETKAYFQSRFKWDDMVKSIYAPVYLRYLTIAEIKTATEFYNSDIGKKMAATDPILINMSRAKFDRAYAGDLQAIVRDEVRSRLKEALEEIKGQCGQDC